MAERSFAKEVETLRLGEGDEFHGEGILAVTKALLQSGVAYVGGYLMLHFLGGLRRWRRSTLRFQEENARIEDWLGRIEETATGSYALAVELAKAQRLVKGYGDTHERGWRNFSTLLKQLQLLAARSDGAVLMARLVDAALADEDGVALGREVKSLAGAR
jgi:indolepyruvate ferredoxin oxidoreductase beta subunit